MAVSLNLASRLSSLHNSLAVDKFRPIHLRYLQYLPQDNSFKLYLDKGDTQPAGDIFRSPDYASESQKLMQYFYIGLCLSNSKFWVNLRPDSLDNIIDEYLAKTDIGKVMLETDLELKKDTARYTSPATPEGREYWDKLYKKAEALYGYENVTIPTLTRPWIVPGEIIIRESADSAYIYKATLKVKLESDYLAQTKAGDSFRSQDKGALLRKLSPELNTAYAFKDSRSRALNEYSTQLIKELIIPKLTKEVNSSKKYAPLRQVYYSLILAQWFKTRYSVIPAKAGIQKLLDSQNFTNLTSKTPWSKDTYFNAYKKSFAEGAYNIQEPVYTPSGQVIRTYFSGGITGIAPVIPLLGSSPVIDPNTGAIITSITSSSVNSDTSNIVRNSKFLVPVLVFAMLSTADLTAATIRVQDQAQSLVGDSLITQTKPLSPGIQLDEEQTRATYLGRRTKTSFNDINDTTSDVRKDTLLKHNKSNSNYRFMEEAVKFGQWFINEMYAVVRSIKISILSFSAKVFPGLAKNLLTQHGEGINDRDHNVRWNATIAIDDIAKVHPELRKEVVTLLTKPGTGINDRDRNVRNYVVWMLGDIAHMSPELTEKMLDLITMKPGQGINATDHNVRYDAVRAIEKIGIPDTYQLKRLLHLFITRIMDIQNNGFSAKNIISIYRNKDFCSQTETLIEGKQMEEPNQFSVARGIEAVLVRFGKEVNDENISKVLPFILGEWLKQGKQVVVDNNSRVVASFHQDEKQFDSQKVAALFKGLGINTDDPRIFVSYRGTLDLNKRAGVKDGLRNKLRDPNFDLFYFNHHGTKRQVWFTGGEESDNLYRPDALSYKEFAEDLLIRADKNQGKLSDLVIIIHACYSADFVVNTLNELMPAIKSGRIKDLPHIITNTNRNMTSYHNIIDNLQKLARGKNELRLSDFYGLEVLEWPYQDMAAFLPISDRSLVQLKELLGVTGERNVLLENNRAVSQIPEGVLPLGSFTEEVIPLNQDVPILNTKVMHSISTGASFALGDKDKESLTGASSSSSAAGQGEVSSAVEEPLRAQISKLAKYLSLVTKVAHKVTIHSSGRVEADKLQRDASNKDLGAYIAASSEYSEHLGADVLRRLSCNYLEFSIGVPKVEIERVLLQMVAASRYEYNSHKEDQELVGKIAYLLAMLARAGKVSFTPPRPGIRQYISIIRGDNVSPKAKNVADYIISQNMLSHFARSLPKQKWTLEIPQGTSKEWIYAKLMQKYGIKPKSSSALSEQNPRKETSVLPTERLGGIYDPVRSSSSLTIDSPTSNPGGIDFRSLPIVTQAISNLSLDYGFRRNDVNLGDRPRRGPSADNLAKEWSSIEQMASSGIKPSPERIKEYAQASSALDRISQDKDKIILCIADILRQEEENCCVTDPTLRDILVVLETVPQTQELQKVFLGKAA